MDKAVQINFFILTGGPGSGKTTVLNELKAKGFAVVPEVARSIIKAQQKIGGNALHTANRKAFRDLMLQHAIHDYKSMQTELKPVFFDRGIPDLIGYSNAFCGEANTEIESATAQFRYNQTVFIFPPWFEIYENDSERLQDFKEAKETYQAMCKAYSDYDYNLIIVPKLPVKNRVEFILTCIEMNY